jgi:hypothetical protein
MVANAAARRGELHYGDNHPARGHGIVAGRLNQSGRISFTVPPMRIFSSLH